MVTLEHIKYNNRTLTEPAVPQLYPVTYEQVTDRVTVTSLSDRLNINNLAQSHLQKIPYEQIRRQ